MKQLLRIIGTLLLLQAGLVHATPAADAGFDVLSNAFLSAYWKAMPDAAIEAGRFDDADVQQIPNQATRQRTLRFASDWLRRLATVDAEALDAPRRADLGLMRNELESIRWKLSTFRSDAWNPANVNMSGTLDAILNTDYAPKEQRLRAIMKRLASGPAYYQAGLASIDRPTREHTALALTQLPGALTLLDEIGQAVETSGLRAAEKKIFAVRLQQNRVAINTFIASLQRLSAHFDDSTTRSFRIGKVMHDAKFGYEIQSGFTAQQSYERALVAKEESLQRMAQLTEMLWPKYMPTIPMPAGRSQRIKQLIDKLSENHIARDALFAEVRREIPLLEQWVTSHDLVSMDASKPLIVRETPAYQRGVAGASIDAPGPFQAKRATYYNVTPIDGETPQQAESFLREYNTWILQLLNIHEAIPGHYVQLIHANRSPSIIKTVFGNGAMIEGWAVYGERMMLDSGYGGNTPEMWLMYSKWHLRSICNTILDYSVQVLGMSEAEAKALMIEDAFQSGNEAAGKWRRLQVTSVQLTSYLTGYSEIMALR